MNYLNKIDEIDTCEMVPPQPSHDSFYFNEDGNLDIDLHKDPPYIPEQEEEEISLTEEILNGM